MLVEPMASDPLTDAPKSAPPSAAAQLASLVHSTILVDPDGVIRQVNNATESLLGTSAKRIVGKPFAEMVVPLSARVAQHVASGQERLVARDVRLRLTDRDVLANLAMSTLVSHPGWRVVTISVLGHENSSGEGRGEGGGEGEGQETNSPGAPSILAHEIKNPLSAIRGAAQLIARKLPHGDKALSRMIIDEVDRIARLIDRMQQLGSSTSDPVAPCNPHEAIRAAVATVRAAGMKDVSVVEEFDPSIPSVLANRDALEQVLINLLSNARDAAVAAHGDGGSEPTISIRTRYVSGHVFSAIRLGRPLRLPVEITVSDNGSGIDPSVRDHVFDPFVSSKPSGQGLGLALVRKLMRDMHGSISHDRDGKAGLTHFRIHLPIAGKGSV